MKAKKRNMTKARIQAEIARLDEMYAPKGRSNTELKAIVNAFYKAFKGTSEELFMMGLERYIAKKEHFPRPADIKLYIIEIKKLRKVGRRSMRKAIQRLAGLGFTETHDFPGEYVLLVDPETLDKRRLYYHIFSAQE